MEVPKPMDDMVAPFIVYAFTMGDWGSTPFGASFKWTSEDQGLALLCWLLLFPQSGL